MDEKLSLIDRLANQLGCEYVNHLYHLRLLDRQQKSRLLDELEKIPAEVVSLFGWNNALEYLAGEAKESSAERAREKLLVVLTQMIYGTDDGHSDRFEVNCENLAPND